MGVYDGGLTEYGVALKEHLRKYYFNNDPNPKIDYVICSHPDQDHAVGLTEILENFEVGMLVMNRPWLYVDELFPKVYDGGVTKASLEKRLRESYPYADALETLAKDKGIPIQEGFQGTDIDGHLTILSPSRDFYLQLLVESSKTPLHEDAHNLLAYIKTPLRRGQTNSFGRMLRPLRRTKAPSSYWAIWARSDSCSPATQVFGHWVQLPITQKGISTVYRPLRCSKSRTTADVIMSAPLS